MKKDDECASSNVDDSHAADVLFDMMNECENLSETPDMQNDKEGINKNIFKC